MRLELCCKLFPLDLTKDAKDQKVFKHGSGRWSNVLSYCLREQVRVVGRRRESMMSCLEFEIQFFSSSVSPCLPLSFMSIVVKMRYSYTGNL